MFSKYLQRIFAAFLFSTFIYKSHLSSLDFQPQKLTGKFQDSWSSPFQNSIEIPQSNVSRQTEIVPQNCSADFDRFTDSVVNFTRCSIRYARPIHICMQCQGDYDASVDAYQKLKKQGAECEAFFFSSDQLGVVDVIFNGAKGLWEKSYCQNCIDHYNETLSFFEFATELSDCIKNSNRSVFTDKNSTCQLCHLVYANLSQSYNSFVDWKMEFSGGICMDIIDTMNISRRLWSQNQCAIEFDTLIGVANVLSALTIGVFPVMFYLLAKNISRLEDVRLVVPKRKFTSQTPPEPPIQQ